MKQQVSLREMNQHLATYIAAVENGDEVVITRRGKPIAKLTALINKRRQLSVKQKKAWEQLSRMMKKGADVGGPMKREDIYDRS